MKVVELAIIGGGPAGLAAAAEAADAGVRNILIVDENRALGGQYYRQMPKEFRVIDPATLDRNHLAGQNLISSAGREPIRVVLDAEVWGILPDENTLSLATRECCWSVRTKAFMLASGAYDRPVAFPGWTLPGVMTAGAAQIMLKTYRVLPGRRVLVVGSGPLLLALTSQLLDAGADVVAVVEACPVTPWSRHIGRAPALLGDWRTLVDGLNYWRSMHAAGVPYLSAHTIVEAKGQSVVQQAVTARLDAAYQPIQGTEQEWDVDAVCVGYGFLPSTELAKACGCELEYLSHWGCFAPRVDRWMESSAANVFVVGDAAGIGGIKVAQQQGRLAALAVAQRLGYLSDTQLSHREREIRSLLGRLQRFRAVLDDVFAFDEQLQRNLITPDTMICRCEEITAKEVYDAISEGAQDVYGVKLRSRAGLGPCQGRNCSPVVTQMIAERIGGKPEAVEQSSLRPPVKPVSMGLLAGCEVLDPVSAR